MLGTGLSIQPQATEKTAKRLSLARSRDLDFSEWKVPEEALHGRGVRYRIVQAERINPNILCYGTSQATLVPVHSPRSLP